MQNLSLVNAMTTGDTMTTRALPMAFNHLQVETQSLKNHGSRTPVLQICVTQADMHVFKLLTHNVAAFSDLNDATISIR